ncbi:DUF3667 domain-containing protein [Altererythrobacter sp. H2]|uniref:DUF3667 domain-containing protein n=1 Tax=Altererythrobacter sp. H2 TaxID=3108391 RepID=UPI002B4C0B56|nr:DUF3667 domain-containing protein [Altererythrobacter sp. H2]WRK96206.1 DUF3667 domain-containing protein [Altererythrobacter sp. H2]
MSGLGDGIGTAIEGGLLGRAVEPGAGEGQEQAGSATVCANCGTGFTGKFCPECGQKAHIHRSLAAIGHDIMHGVLHLDGKLWNTLPLLAFKPGKLTRRYVDGERAKFVSPMAMFLFTVFAMFAVFQMVGVTAPTDFSEGMIEGFTDNSVVEKRIQEQITALEQERDGLPEGAPRREEIDSEVEALTGVLDAAASAPAGIDTSNIKVTGIGFLDEGIIGKWKSNPGLMLYKLQTNAYKFSWLLIPLSIPFVWLLFAWRRQFKAYDHAVFVTYSLAFMSLLFIAMSLLGVIPGGWGNGIAAILLTIGAPLHLYKQLRHAYGLTRFSALWRFFALLIFINLVIVLFLQTLLVLGAF